MRRKSAVVFLALGLALSGCGGVPSSVLEAQSGPMAQAAIAESAPKTEARAVKISQRPSAHTEGSGHSQRWSPTHTVNADLQLTHPSPTLAESGADQKRATAAAGNSVAVSVSTGQRRWQDWLEHERQRDEDLKKKLIICRC